MFQLTKIVFEPYNTRVFRQNCAVEIQYSWFKSHYWAKMSLKYCPPVRYTNIIFQFIRIRVKYELHPTFSCQDLEQEIREISIPFISNIYNLIIVVQKITFAQFILNGDIRVYSVFQNVCKICVTNTVITRQKR